MFNAIGYIAYGIALLIRAVIALLVAAAAFIAVGGLILSIIAIAVVH